MCWFRFFPISFAPFPLRGAPKATVTGPERDSPPEGDAGPALSADPQGRVACALAPPYGAREKIAFMKVAVASDMDTPLARSLVEELRRRGHEPIPHGVLAEGERSDWAWACELAARDVVEGRADQGVVCCWTGTGASIAANKVAGVRAALCADAETARGARAWNDANVLALSLRATSEALLGEILDAWFSGDASDAPDDRANVEHIAQLDNSRAETSVK